MYRDSVGQGDADSLCDFDSVWADKRDQGGGVDHIEVITYSETQALPMALIDYKHKSSGPSV